MSTPIQERFTPLGAYSVGVARGLETAAQEAELWAEAAAKEGKQWSKLAARNPGQEHEARARELAASYVSDVAEAIRALGARR